MNAVKATNAVGKEGTERTNEWFTELGRLPMSNREVGDGGVGGGGGVCA